MTADRSYQIQALSTDLAQSVTAATSLDDILRSVAHLAAQCTDAERASLFLHDANNDQLVLRYTTGVATPAVSMPVDAGLVGDTYRTARPLVVDDCYADDRFDSRIDEVTGLTTKSVVSVPIGDGNGGVVGVVQCLNGRRGGFDHASIDALAQVAAQAATAIASHTIIDELRTTHAHDVDLLALVTEIAQLVDVDQLVERLVGEISRLMNAERTSVFLYDPAEERLTASHAQGIDIEGLRFPVEDGLIGEAFLSKSPILVRDAYEDSRFNRSGDRLSGFETRSILAVPIIHRRGNDAIGVVEVLNKQEGHFTEADTRRLQSFAAELAISLENARLYESLGRSQRYTQSILKTISVGVLTLDGDGVVVSCNPAAQRILGCGQPDGIATLASLLGRENPWVLYTAARVGDSGRAVELRDVEVAVNEETRSVDLTMQKLPATAPDPQGAYGLLITLDDVTEDKRVRAALGRYVDAAIAEELLSQSELTLGGTTHEATVLFSDMKDFTATSERLGAQATVRLMNDFFTRMVDCVQGASGVVDKFVGDSMMATFGVPVPTGDEAERALKAATSMLTALKDWNIERRRTGDFEVDVGLGLSTGTVVAGNVGAPKRMDFTIIGPGVNEASRLESACRVFGTSALVNDSTLRAATSSWRTRQLGRVRLKGFQHPTLVHELLEHHDSSSFPGVDKLVAEFDTGRDHYDAGRWKLAIDSFERALQSHPDDTMSRMYRNRCQRLVHSPPQGEWDPAWVLPTK